MATSLELETHLALAAAALKAADDELKAAQAQWRNAQRLEDRDEPRMRQAEQAYTDAFNNHKNAFDAWHAAR